MGKRAPALNLESIPKADVDTEWGSEDVEMSRNVRSPVSMDEDGNGGHSNIGLENGRPPRSKISWLDAQTKLDKEGSESENAEGSEYSIRNNPITPDTGEEEKGDDFAALRGLTPLALNQENIAVGLSWLWQTSAFSDLIISCKTYSFPAHKCILAAQCRYFNKIIRKPETLVADSKGTFLKLDDDDPEALKAMLQYLYTGVLVVPMTSVIILDGPEVPSIDVLLKVNELGCKYELPQLKKEAAKQYINVLEMQWPKGHPLILARCLVRTFKMAMAGAAEEEGVWYEDSAMELKEVTFNVAVKFVDELLSDPVVSELLSRELLRALIMKMIRRDNPVKYGAVAKSPVRSPGVSPLPAPGCSGGGCWQ